METIRVEFVETAMATSLICQERDDVLISTDVKKPPRLEGNLRGKRGARPRHADQKPEAAWASGQIDRHAPSGGATDTFFYPDCTVGSGVRRPPLRGAGSPDHVRRLCLRGLVGCTTDRELARGFARALTLPRRSTIRLTTIKIITSARGVSIAPGLRLITIST